MPRIHKKVFPSMHHVSNPHTIAKRIVAVLHDSIALLTVASIVSFALVEPAWAYVDPSVMTYAIQALAGVAIAIGAVAGVAFRRSRKAIFKLLNIDENAGKSIEAEVCRIGDCIRASKIQQCVEEGFLAAMKIV